MSFVDLATLTLHRRNELEARINVFLEKCDHAIGDIHKLKVQAQSFVLQLNCEPPDLKERFLSCMKQLDEYTYLITDFNLAVGQLEENHASELTPEHDSIVMVPLLTPHAAAPLNLIDALSEPTPSTSTACPNLCPSEKPKRFKVPKKEQVLIAFSSASSSSESVPQSKGKSEEVAKEVQCDLTAEDVNNLTITCVDAPSPESCNLPAQKVLQVDHMYEATIMSMDEGSFWVITDKIEDVCKFMTDMTEYYKKNHVNMTLEDVASLTYCAFYDEDSECFYRALFIKILEDDLMSVEVFLVDTGEVRTASVGDVQPLVPGFCASPPYARCCHLAGIDLLSCNNKELLEKQTQFVKQYVGRRCNLEVDDNTSESLGVYVILPTKEILNDILVQQGFATANRPKSPQPRPPQSGPPPSVDSDLDITEGPEYEDPVEAVTGYSNRDEAEICKHYKGGLNKTCFKGARCTKKHILKHPDGWTLDRVEVAGKLRGLALPPPGSWHKVHVTYVCHFDRLYVQFVKEKETVVVAEKMPSFGVVLPAASLPALVRDMNSPAARMAYRPLQMPPAPGELVAALYPLDNLWYRARVLTVSRGDQNVEVMYVDYGNVVWVKEDEVRVLERRYLSLPIQAVRCVLAGVSAKTSDSQQWAAAKAALASMVQEQTLDARLIARSYDELVIELYDPEGYSVAEQLAAHDMVALKEYAVDDDSKRTTSVCPA